MFPIAYLLFFFAGFFPVPNDMYLHSALSLWLLALLAWQLRRDQFLMRLLFNDYTQLMLVWVLWGLVALLWSLDFTSWLEQWLVIWIAFVHTVSLSYLVKQPDFMGKLLLTFIAANGVHNLIGWYEWLSGNYHFAYQASFPAYHDRWKIPLSFFYNENYFALYVLICLLFIIYWRTDLKALKWLLVVSNGLLIMVLGSRGVIALLWVAFFIMLFLQLESWRARRQYLLFGLVAALSGLLLAWQNGVIAEILADPSLQVRVNLILNGLIILGDKFLIGVGPGSSAIYLAHRELLPVEGYNVLHNWWASILVTHGLVFFVWYVYRYLKKIYLAAKHILAADAMAAKGLFTVLLILVVGVAIPDTLAQSLWFWLIMCLIDAQLLALENNNRL